MLFIWGFISWAVMPWYNAVANEAAVAQVLKTSAAKAGVYYLSFAEEDHKPGEAAVFVNVLPNGFDMNMGKLMATALVGQFIAVLLVLLLLRQTCGLSYCQRVGFVALAGLAIGFISHFPYWNWFGFSSGYVAVIVVDTLIGWVLAGLVMAKFITGKMA